MAGWGKARTTQNYRVVFADLDTADWARPGVAKIVQDGLPNDDRGAVVMLHDGAGIAPRPLRRSTN
jgi:hypothetical protein